MVDKRDSATVIPIIDKHVKPGTTIHTDCWKAYDGLGDAGYVHHKVNHSDIENRFVAQDGTYTQRIEATWRPAKNLFRGRHYAKGQFANYLCENRWLTIAVKQHLTCSLAWLMKVNEVESYISAENGENGIPKYTIEFRINILTIKIHATLLNKEGENI
nr:unnamed protein product [Callosobruchus chinensis]CAH7719653.1 unnamed protein product [Callosobruchus chinensis]